jgi:hypothetical protein
MGQPIDQEALLAIVLNQSQVNSLARQYQDRSNATEALNSIVVAPEGFMIESTTYSATALTPTDESRLLLKRQRYGNNLNTDTSLASEEYNSSFRNDFGKSSIFMMEDSDDEF